MKQCTICGEVKPLLDFYYAKDKGVKRYKSACKECMKAKATKHYHTSRYGHYNSNDSKIKTKDKVDLVTKYLDACDYNPNNLDCITKDKFRRLFKIDEQFDFKQLKHDVLKRLEDMGYCNPTTLDLATAGNYLIIGDTFGKKTSTNKFQMLVHLADRINAKAIIAIGHNTDDYNDVSNAFTKFDIPVYFIPVKNELKDIQTYCTEADQNSHIILDKITVGDITIRNQEHITPYVKTAISSLDPLIYKGKCIVNCTRHEYFQRTATGAPSYIASPGAMAEPHVIRVAYKLTLANGGRVNVTPVGRDSFLKYRKNDIDKDLWECGCIVVNYDMVHTNINMVRIQEHEGYASCVYFDQTQGIYVDSHGARNITPDVAILSDMHAPYVDLGTYNKLLTALSNQKPRRITVNGDFLDCRSMNPHNEYEARQADFEYELTTAEGVAAGLAEVAPLNILFGNHEDFIRRFTNQYPQLWKFIKRAIDDRLTPYAKVAWCDTDAMFNHATDILVTHGSNKLYGISGKQIEKLAKSCPCGVIMGHTHSPTIRFGVYCAGCLCNYDQQYNNSITHNWQHGYILTYSKDNRTYIQQMFL